MVSTFARIKEDKRHTDIQLIAFSPIERKLFIDWRIRGFGLFHLNLELEKQLLEKYGREEGSIRLPEKETVALKFAEDIDLI